MRKTGRETLRGSDLNMHLKGSTSLILPAVHIHVLHTFELKCITEGLPMHDQEGKRHERMCRIQTACLSIRLKERIYSKEVSLVPSYIFMSRAPFAFCQCQRTLEIPFLQRLVEKDKTAYGKVQEQDAVFLLGRFCRTRD